MYDGDGDERQGVSGGKFLVFEEGREGLEGLEGLRGTWRDSSEPNPVSSLLFNIPYVPTLPLGSHFAFRNSQFAILKSNQIPSSSVPIHIDFLTDRMILPNCLRRNKYLSPARANPLVTRHPMIPIRRTREK